MNIDEIERYLNEDLRPYSSVLSRGKSFTCREGTDKAIHYEKWGCGVLCAAIRSKSSADLFNINEDDEFFCIEHRDEWGSLTFPFEYDASWLGSFLQAAKRMKKWLDENFEKNKDVPWCYGKYKGLGNNMEKWFTVNDLLEFITRGLASGELDGNGPVLLPNDEFLDISHLEPKSEWKELVPRVSSFDPEKYREDIEDSIKRWKGKHPTNVRDSILQEYVDRLKRYKSYEKGLVIGEI